MLRPNLKHPRLNDPFWQVAGLVLAVVLAVQSCHLVMTTKEQRAAERERIELIRDGD